MDGLEELQSVVVIGATNRPNLIDPALLRPGRFDELIYVAVPDQGGRRHILGIHTSKMPLAPTMSISTASPPAPSGSPARSRRSRPPRRPVRFAGVARRRDDHAEHFERALKETRASVTPGNGAGI
jgi:transitional endoplasmic reticulum ATPase